MMSNDQRLRRFNDLILGLLVMVVIARFLAPAAKTERFGIIDDADGLRLQDFAGIFVMTKAILDHGPIFDDQDVLRPGYRHDAVLAVQRRWVGRPLTGALAYPQAPTMLWFLGPLRLLPTNWAYIAFTVLGLALIGWMTRPGRLPAIAGPLLFLSPIGVVCFALGQFGIMTAAGWMYLALYCLRSEPERWATCRSAAVVLWLLTGKPNFALVAGAGLLARGDWRTVLLAVLYTIVGVGAATWWLGPNWPGDYLYLLTHYNLESIPAVFRSSIDPSQMSNLRALLTIDLGMRDDRSCQWSTAIWLLAIGLTTLAGWRRWLDMPSVWSLLIIIHLIFCPHVNSYEELNLAVVLMLQTRQASTSAGRWGWSIAIVTLMFLSPALGPLQGHRWPPVLLIGKVGVLLTLLGSRLISIRTDRSGPGASATGV